MADPVYNFSIELQTGSFTDLSTRVERASWGNALVDMFNAPQVGRAMFELANDDATLSPRVNSSFSTGKALKLTATYSGTSYPLFFGRITDISLASELGVRTTIIEAVDDWDRISGLRYTTQLYSGTAANSLFTALMSLSAVNSMSVTQVSGDNVGIAWYRDAPAIPAIHELVQAGNYQLVVDGNGTYNLYGRNYTLFAANNTYTVDVRSFGMSLRCGLSRETTINRTRIVSTPRVQATSVATIAYIPQPLQLTSGVAVGNIVWYKDPLQPSENEVPVGSLVTPVASTHWYVSANSDGTGTDLTSAVTLAFTAYGASAISTFTNNSSAGWLTRAHLLGYPMQRLPEQTQQFDVTTSQTKFGVREFVLNNRLVQWDATLALALATKVCSDRRDGMHEAKGTLFNTFPGQLSQTLSSVITVVDAFSGPDTTWRIRGTDHELDLTQGLKHKTTFLLDTPDIRFGWGVPYGYIAYAMPAGYAVWGGGWSATDHHANVGISGTVATDDGTDLSHTHGAKGDTYHSSGKWYAEFQILNTMTSTVQYVGMAQLSQTTVNNQRPDSGGGGIGYSYSNNQKKGDGALTAYGITWGTTGDVISMLYDGDAGTLIFWVNGATQGTAFTGLSGSYTPMISISSQSSSIKATVGANFN